MRALFKSWVWDFRAVIPGLLVGSWAMQALCLHLHHVAARAL